MLMSTCMQLLLVSLLLTLVKCNKCLDANHYQYLLSLIEDLTRDAVDHRIQTKAMDLQLQQALSRIEELTNNAAAQRTETEAMAIKLQHALSRVEELKQEKSAIVDRSEKTEIRDDQEETVARRRIVVNNRIAFSARMTKDVKHITGLPTMLFDDVEINDGGGYNSRTGTFACPRAGTYFFMATIMAHNGGWVEALMVKGGQFIAELHIEMKNTGLIVQTSNSVITHCNQGQSVWLVTQGNNNTVVYAGAKANFAGFMLWEDDL